VTRQERRRLARKPPGVRGVVTIEQPPIASHPLLQEYDTRLDEGTRPAPVPIPPRRGPMRVVLSAALALAAAGAPRLR
jgi:hypothetical protein